MWENFKLLDIISPKQYHIWIVTIMFAMAFTWAFNVHYLILASLLNSYVVLFPCQCFFCKSRIHGNILASKVYSLYLTQIKLNNIVFHWRGVLRFSHMSTQHGCCEATTTMDKRTTITFWVFWFCKVQRLYVLCSQH